MWSSGEQVEYSGRSLTIQSAEFALITALEHGFTRGTRSDALQTVVDSAWLLPRCKANDLLLLLKKSGLVEPFKELLKLLDVVAPAERVSKMARLIDSSNVGAHNASARHSVKPGTESAVLRQPVLYKLWNVLGRRPRLERLVLRWIGPFSKPLKPAPPKEEYDLRDCAAIDEIGGPGWAWPHPDRVCFWGDRADSRLMIPLQHVDDCLLVIALDQEQQKRSPNGRIDVFANGHYATKIDKKNSGTCCVAIARHMLLGPWVELSLRPKHYAQHGADPFAGRSVALRRLRILDRKNLTRVFSGHLAQLNAQLLRGEEPYASKLARIKAKIETSPHKNASELPKNFDPLLYVLSYGDLFEHEVDPYEHFISFGRHENRAWR
jgi:hypothetical protein